MTTMVQAYTNTSGALSGGFGIITTGAAVGKKAGFLDWVDENSIRIGLVCTILTAVVYITSKILEMILRVLEHRSKIKKG